MNNSNFEQTKSAPVAEPEITSGNHYVAAPNQRKVPVVAIVLLAAVFAGGLYWRSRTAGGGAAKPASTKSAIRTVRVMPIGTGTIVSELDVTGTLKTNQNVSLAAKIAGHIKSVFITEGQRVKRGELLIQLDDADERQQLDAAKANLQAAQVALLQTKVGLPARIDQVQTNIDQARAALKTAQSKYKQAQLNEPSAITQAQSQVQVAREGVKSAQAQVAQSRTNATQTQTQVTAGIESAEANLKQSQAQLDQTVSGSREQQVAQAQAQVNLAQAQLNDAQTTLTRQQQLFQGGAAAKATVDSAQTAFAVQKATLESAQQNLSLVKEGSRTQEVQAAQEVVRERQAALATARAAQGDVLKAQSAVTTSLATLGQAEQQQRQAISNLSQVPIARQNTATALQAVNEAQAALQQALSNRSQIPVAKADIPASQAKVSQAAAQVEQAQLNLNYTRIVSPIDGVVNTKLADVGQSAAPGTALLNLVALNSVYFEAQVPESQLPQIKVGQSAKIYVTAVSSAPVAGYVSDIIPVADPTLRQFRVRISLPGRKDLTPGAFARGVLKTQIIKDTLVVPNEDLHNDGDQAYLLIAKGTDANTVVQRKDVVLGPSQGSMTQIASGVNKGERLITSNAIFSDGDKIKTVAQSTQ